MKPSCTHTLRRITALRLGDLLAAGGGNEFAVEDAARADKVVGHVEHFAAQTAQDDHFEAVLLGEVDVHGGYFITGSSWCQTRRSATTNSTRGIHGTIQTRAQ